MSYYKSKDSATVYLLNSETKYCLKGNKIPLLVNIVQDLCVETYHGMPRICVDRLALNG